MKRIRGKKECFFFVFLLASSYLCRTDFCSVSLIMYNQIREDTIYIMLYAVVTAMSLIASCYLLFRRGNAIAPDITPPTRLRRWTAAFLAFLALNHMWYMPILFLTSDEDVKLNDLVGGLLDSMTILPLSIIVMLTMLQDRRHPLWPVAVIVLPQVVGMGVSVATRSTALFPLLYGYFLLMCIGFIIYMVRALRQYGRWLRDNYADLEHKEVWHSFVMMAIMLLVFGVYAIVGKGPVCQYAMLVVCIALVCYLPWRVETLSDLTPTVPQPASSPVPQFPKEEITVHANIGPLLQRYCIDTQLYLQHDLTLLQLAKAIGVNRFYLSQYFSSMGTNYNAYINDLRINHFTTLYREAVAAKRSVTAQQLALDSGYKSYSTFSKAFKNKMGLSVTTWIKSQQEG